MRSSCPLLISFLSSCGGGRDSCEGPSLIWIIVIRSHRGVRVVDIDGQVCLSWQHVADSVHDDGWTRWSPHKLLPGWFYVRKTDLQQRFLRTQDRCWPVSDISPIDPWSIVLGLRVASCRCRVGRLLGTWPAQCRPRCRMVASILRRDIHEWTLVALDAVLPTDAKDSTEFRLLEPIQMFDIATIKVCLASTERWAEPPPRRPCFWFLSWGRENPVCNAYFETEI